MKTLLLIDAHSLIHRAFHALPPLTAPDGRPTQALYGVASMLLKLWREDPPEYAAALFDRPEPTFRKEKYAEYKAHRPEAPDTLISQIIEARELFRQFGIASFEIPGYEADDLIATLAERFRNTPDVQVVILTGDLDTLQLIRGDALVVRTFRRGLSDTMIYDEAAVYERYGLPPSALPDYKALVGDPSDNVPGVSGVGAKTATSLLQKYGTLDAFLEHIDREPKFSQRAEAVAREARFSRDLVILNPEAPLEVRDLASLNSQPLESREAYLASLGFSSLIERMKRSEGGVHAPKPMQKKKTPTPSSVLPSDAIIVGEATLWDEGSSPLFQGAGIKVGFRLKERLKVERVSGHDIAPPFFDLGVAFWLIDPDTKEYSADMVSRKYLKRPWSGGRDEYAALFSLAQSLLAERGLVELFRDVEMQLLPVLAEMELWGIQVNREKLASVERDIDSRLAERVREIHALAGEEFNINSTQQLARILFEKLHLSSKSKRTTAHGARSTSADLLEELRDVHPIIPAVLAYREDFKIQSTYVRALAGLVAHDGRIHTEFVQTGAATGRLSSQNPNLQNIPKESIWSDSIRRSFEAAAGYSLVSFDYSQVELRILASVANERRMIEAFEAGHDIHQMTAAEIFRVPVADVRPEMRRVAKTLNFGLIYGMGVSSFAKTSGLSRASAQEFVENYFAAFPGIKEWQEEVKSFARTHGYVQTLTGRRRYLPSILSGSPRFVAEAERIAINQPLQGLSADITKRAMVGVRKALQERGLWGEGVRLLLSIHDELLFEVRDDMMGDVLPLVRDLMEHAYPLQVALKVDVRVGNTWGDLEPYTS